MTLEDRVHVTGVGSLPLLDAAAAVRFVARHAPTVPFWPQLPRRAAGEGMILQTLRGLEELLRQAGGRYRCEARDRDRLLEALAKPAPLDVADAAALPLLIEALGSVPELAGAVAVKAQLAGPVTVASMLEIDGASALGDGEVMAALGTRIALDAAGLIRTLGDATPEPPILFVLDEPALGVLDEPALGVLPPDEGQLASLRELLRELRTAGATIAGLHCCAEIPFRWLRELEPDLFSFDANQGLEAFYRDEDALAWLDGGGRAALGLIPTDRRLEDDAAESISERWRRALPAGRDPAGLAAGTLITASCGLAGLDEEAAATSFTSAHAVARKLQDYCA